MKNSTHYRLRALACALLASAAMLGACDDDDPNDDPDPGKKPPVTLTDQIQYDGGDLVGIKSAIYVAEEDGSHTFYLSPTEGLINAEQMKQRLRQSRAWRSWNTHAARIAVRRLPICGRVCLL